MQEARVADERYSVLKSGHPPPPMMVVKVFPIFATTWVTSETAQTAMLDSIAATGRFDGGILRPASRLDVHRLYHSNDSFRCH